MMQPFNTDLDRITLEELSEDLQNMIMNAGSTALSKLNTHVNNVIVHINNADRANWNSKAPTDSPAFTGTPTAPTPDQATNNEQIATTNYVNNKLTAYVAPFAKEAKSLATTSSFSIDGAITSNKVQFDGTNDVVLNVNSVATSFLNGTINKANLSGTYDINVSGTATRATFADQITGFNPDVYAQLNNPQFTGVPTVPTPNINDNSTTIANTKYVNQYVEKAISGISDVNTAKILANKKTIAIGGKATASGVVFDGSDNITLNVTNLDISDQLASFSPTTINGHTVETNVPADAKFTDTLYIHPETIKDLTDTEWLKVAVDRDGHVISGSNPNTLDVSVTGNSASTDKLKTPINITFSNMDVTTVHTDFSSDVVVDVNNIPADTIKESDNKRFITKAQLDKLSSTVTADDVNNLIGQATKNITWKEAVDTFDKLKTTYPTPSEGWAVEVKDTGDIYRYDADTRKWIGISANSLPLATQTNDGKMSKDDKKKLDGIEAGAQKNPTEIDPSIIKVDDNHQFVTKAQTDTINDALTKTEASNTYLTKHDTNITDMTLGEGDWKFAVNESGNLEVTYNNIVVDVFGKDGSFLSQTFKEGTSDNAEKLNQLVTDNVIEATEWKSAIDTEANLKTKVKAQAYDDGSIIIAQDTKKMYMVTGNKLYAFNGVSFGDEISLD